MTAQLRYAIVPSAEHDRRARTASSPEAGWARLGDRTVVWAPVDSSARLTDEHVPSLSAECEATGGLHLVIQTGRAFQDAFPQACIAVDKGRHLIVDLTGEEALEAAAHVDACFSVAPIPVGDVVIDRVGAARRAVLTAATDPAVESLLDGVDRVAYESTLRHLAGFPTRHSLSTDFSDAAAWAAGQFHDLGYETTFEHIDVDGSKSMNLIGRRAGKGDEPRGLVLVTAHLDSINREGPHAPAPGADDNASGAAAVLEIGRLLAAQPARHDLRLILFGGEEEGLYGSTQHVATLPAAERACLRAVINMDMVATRNTAAPTVLVEGAAISQPLMDQLAAAAAAHTNLTVETSLHPYNSDHVPFIKAGLPAVLTIEGTDTANGNVHTANDTLDHIDYDLAIQIVRMNLAASAALLNGPPPHS